MKKIKVTTTSVNVGERKEFFNKVASVLGCKASELLKVSVNEESEDKEGWNIESYFPTGSKIDQENLSGFDVPVLKLSVDGSLKAVAEPHELVWNIYVSK